MLKYIGLDHKKKVPFLNTGLLNAQTKRKGAFLAERSRGASTPTQGRRAAEEMVSNLESMTGGGWQIFMLALGRSSATLLSVTLYRRLRISLYFFLFWFLFCYFYLEVGSCEGNHLEIPSCVQREVALRPHTPKLTDCQQQ